MNTTRLDHTNCGHAITRVNIRTAARTAPGHLDRLNWLRENAPEIAMLIEAEARTQIRPTAADYPRVAMQRFSRLVNGR